MHTGMISTLRRLSRQNAVFLAAFAAFYLLVQGMAAAHAVEYGGGDHTHNGQVCLLGTVASRDDTADIPVVAIMPAPTFHGRTVLPEQCFCSPLLGVSASRPRGPPAFQ